MRIASSSVALSSTQVSVRTSTRQVSMKAWIGDEPPARAAGAQARPGVAGLAAPAVASLAAAPPPVTPVTPAAPQGQAEDDAAAEGRAKGTPREELDLAILRRTFRLGHGLTRAAREVQDAYQDRRPAAATAAPAPAPPAADQPAAPAREGWGLRYDSVETSFQYQATTFAASAQVTTADGRSIAIQAALSMERTEVRTSEVHLLAGDAAKVDPLVLNLQGGAARFSGATSFDLDADGERERVAALGPGSAYLALDRNGNGAVDSGAELFGPTTGSGFGELAALDGDGNGWVDEGDAAFSRLRLWSPASGALSTLKAAGVGALYTGSVATAFDLQAPGGAPQGSVAETGLFLREDGSAGTVQHVDLVA